MSPTVSVVFITRFCATAVPVIKIKKGKARKILFIKSQNSSVVLADKDRRLRLNSKGRKCGPLSYIQSIIIQEYLPDNRFYDILRSYK